MCGDSIVTKSEEFLSAAIRASLLKDHSCNGTAHLKALSNLGNYSPEGHNQRQQPYPLLYLPAIHPQMVYCFSYYSCQSPLSSGYLFIILYKTTTNKTANKKESLPILSKLFFDVFFYFFTHNLSNFAIMGTREGIRV